MLPIHFWLLTTFILTLLSIIAWFLRVFTKNLFSKVDQLIEEQKKTNIALAELTAHNADINRRLNNLEDEMKQHRSCKNFKQK